MKKLTSFLFVSLLLSFSLCVKAEEVDAETLKYRQMLEKEHQNFVKKNKVKLKKYDKKVFDEFVFLGLSHCFDVELLYPDTMNDAYIRRFNGKKALFPRLIEYDDLKKELANFHRNNFKDTPFKGYIATVNECQAVYNLKNKKLRQKYLQIINNPQYQQDWISND